ncbi:putative leucine aminopeptidase 2 [Flagelloscypha sp. PMI_526]|nr:putative leucine aminopeptidase 2 [Flagelloscypha sp. PMI_526]
MLARSIVTFACLLTTIFAQDANVESFGGGSQSGGRKEVDIKQLNATLLSLANIAEANGGNRAFGLPGYDASVDFILKSIRKFDKDNSFHVWTQPFVALWTQVTVHELDISETESYVPNPLTYSPSTPAGGITAELAIVPGSITPCTAQELLDTGEDFTGKILLIERGSCPDGTTFAGKVKVAQGVGAASAIIYNNVDAFIGSGTLTAPNPLYVPAGILQRADGLKLRERVLAGEELIVRYEQIQLLENRTTTNIFAETKAGDKHNVIQLGGHLDSVQAGAGINDDGSGSTLVLELLRTLDAKHVKNKVRFSWWGAEENGLLGSAHFISNLAQADVDNLLAYLNFDMVGRGYYGVFDGDGSTYGLVPPAGSDVIESLFQSWFANEGIEVTPAAFTNGSDYRHFWEDIHKPIGGLHTGTGAAQDPCYHQKCDGFDNVNKTQLWINTRAARFVLDKLIKDGPAIIPKSPSNGTSFTVMGKQAGIEWTEIEGESHTCGETV